MSSLLARTATHATATTATTTKAATPSGLPRLRGSNPLLSLPRYDTAATTPAASGRTLAMSALSVAPSGASMAATACGSPRVRP